MKDNKNYLNIEGAMLNADAETSTPTILGMPKKTAYIAGGIIVIIAVYMLMKRKK